METPEQRGARLIGALEDLAAREAATLAARDFAAAAEIQDRAEPLVALLAAEGAAMTDGGLRGRIAAIVAQRAQTGEKLAEQVAQVRDELGQTRVAQGQVARIAPVYGAATAPLAGRLMAVG